jgi:hypothetical protein
VSKPHIKAFSKNGARKWRCSSEASGDYGPYVREGCGYTPAEAYRKWSRFGGFFKPFRKENATPAATRRPPT